MKIDFKIREITERKPEIHRNKNGKENEIQELAQESKVKSEERKEVKD